MARKPGLGKGLNALIPTGPAEQETDVAPATAVATEEGPFRRVPIANVRPNPNQPRKQFDEEALIVLTESISRFGVLQPPIVRTVPGEPGMYELVAGERRWRASQRANLEMIPVLIRDDVDTVASLEQAIVENLHREDLNPLEEAAAYQQLIDDFALTQEQVAQRVSRSRAVIANTLRLLRLSDPAKEALATNRISAGHGRALLTIPDPVKQEELLSRILSKNLTVRQAEDAAKEITDPVPSPTPGTTTAPGRAKPHLVSVPDPSVVELENLLEAHLETRVTVDLKGKTGKVVIDFADIADLERIYNRMMGK